MLVKCDVISRVVKVVNMRVELQKCIKRKLKEEKPGLSQNVSQILTKFLVIGNKCIFMLSYRQVHNSRAASSR